MLFPNIEDIQGLMQYILQDDEVKEDFISQVCMHNLEAEEGSVFELLDLDPDYPEDLYDNILALGDEEFETFALQFGTTHAYPTALRIMAALNTPTQIKERTELPLTCPPKDVIEAKYNKAIGK